MFQMFDNVLLLADGKIAYYVKASKVVPYISSLGYQCTPHYNPADYKRTRSLSVFFSKNKKRKTEKQKNKKELVKSHCAIFNKILITLLRCFECVDILL